MGSEPFSSADGIFFRGKHRTGKVLSRLRVVLWTKRCPVSDGSPDGGCHLPPHPRAIVFIPTLHLPLVTSPTASVCVRLCVCVCVRESSSGIAHTHTHRRDGFVRLNTTHRLSHRRRLRGEIKGNTEEEEEGAKEEEEEEEGKGGKRKRRRRRWRLFGAE